jgi:hypothetical protein
VHGVLSLTVESIDRDLQLILLVQKYDRARWQPASLVHFYALREHLQPRRGRTHRPGDYCQPDGDRGASAANGQALRHPVRVDPADRWTGPTRGS